MGLVTTTVYSGSKLSRCPNFVIKEDLRLILEGRGQKETQKIWVKKGYPWSMKRNPLPIYSIVKIFNRKII